MKVRCRTVDSLVDDVQRIQRRIAVRAQEVFRARSGALGDALDDWMKAERATIWRPALEVRKTDDAFVVEAAVAGVDPKQFANGPLFRSHTFPQPVDPVRVSAEYRNGLLRVIAPLARVAARVHVAAA